MSALHVLIHTEIYPTIGGKPAHYCKRVYLLVGIYLLLFLRFLYTLYIAVDANFKLKGKQRHLNDVELMGGMGAFVEEEKYQQHLAEYVSQPEVRD